MFGAAYLVAPVFGWHLDVNTMAAVFGALPWIAKFSLKSLVAFPFSYHSINGLRHLTWDTGAGTIDFIIVTNFQHCRIRMSFVLVGLLWASVL